MGKAQTTKKRGGISMRYFGIRAKKILMIIMILCGVMIATNNCNVYADGTDNDQEDNQNFKVYSYKNENPECNKFTNKQKTITVDGFEYIIADGEAAVNKYVGNDKNVTIPAKVNGIPVVFISQNAIFDNDKVESIIISEGIKYISGQMVAFCSNLRYISIPSTADLIFVVSDSGVGKTRNPSEECINLEKYDVSQKNPYICVKNGMIYGKDMTSIIACPSGLKTEKIEVPKSVTYIESNAFSYNQHVKEIVLPESVQIIDAAAFMHAVGLKKFRIPSKCKIIGDFAFWSSYIDEIIIPKDFEGDILKGVFLNTKVVIKVEKGNKRYKIKDNCFLDMAYPIYYVNGFYKYNENHNNYNENNTVQRLVYYMKIYEEEECVIPKGVGYIEGSAFDSCYKIKKIVVPESVLGIGTSAFMYCSNLETINLPDSIKIIAYDTFCECRSLKSITLPNQLEIIEDSAFSCSGLESIYIPQTVKHIGWYSFCCDGLQEIFYEGSKSEWNNITDKDFMGGYKSTIYYNISLKSENEPVFDIPAVKGNNIIKTTFKGVQGWYYVIKGKVNTKFTGFASNKNGWWYVERGKVTFGKNGVIKGKLNGIEAWWYVKDSKVEFIDTVAKNENGWWRIRNGRVNFSYNGIARNYNGWWVCKSGKVDFGYTGFASNSNGWFYCKNGKVDFGINSIISGKVSGQNGWWYVKGGKVQFIDSVERNTFGWWVIKNGKVNFNFNGIAKNAYGTWYLKNGKIDFGFTGLAEENSYRGMSWHYYIKNGRVQLDYNGKVYYEGETYIVENGRVVDRVR